MSIVNLKDSIGSVAEVSSATQTRSEVKEVAPSVPPKDERQEVLTVAELSFHDENATAKEADPRTGDGLAGEKGNNGGLSVISKIYRRLSTFANEKEAPIPIREDSSTQRDCQSGKAKGPLTKLVSRVLKSEKPLGHASKIPDRDAAPPAAETVAETTATSTTETVTQKETHSSKLSTPLLESISKIITPREQNSEQSLKTEVVTSAANDAEDAALKSGGEEGKAKESKNLLQSITKLVCRTSHEVDQPTGEATDVHETVEERSEEFTSGEATDHQTSSKVPRKAESPTKAVFNAIRKGMEKKIHLHEEVQTDARVPTLPSWKKRVSGYFGRPNSGKKSTSNEEKGHVEKSTTVHAEVERVTQGPTFEIESAKEGQATTTQIKIEAVKETSALV
ncbi:hypothetical protein CBS101457_001262 [Exobasidium rhododendri]|nr:hypothetical protein CBS101457_001262 [Exobasidium rhododendri]